MATTISVPQPLPNEPEGLFGITPENIPRIPWSELGPDFISKWGRANPRNPQPEHLEYLGTTGSGKTFFLTQILAEMVRRRKSSVIFIATKEADETVSKMGWPIVSSWEEVQRHPQCIFWPRSSLKGKAYRDHQAAAIEDLLDNLWTPNANTIVVFDEIGYLESLSTDLKSTIQKYLREGRSHGITCVMGKQRGQGAGMEMHGQTDWKIAFKVNKQSDMEYVSGILGDEKQWVPIIKSLNRAKHEFIIVSMVHERAAISWIDKPVSTRLPQKDYYEK